DVHDCFWPLAVLCGETGDYIGFFRVARTRPLLRDSAGAKRLQETLRTAAQPPLAFQLLHFDSVHARGRLRHARHKGPPRTARVYADSSSFSQAVGMGFCSTVETRCSSARKLWPRITGTGISAASCEPRRDSLFVRLAVAPGTDRGVTA